LVKATLIASAVGVRELGCSSARHIPSPDQGWGVIQLDRALHFPGDAERLYVKDQLDRGFSSAQEPAYATPLTVEGDAGLKVVLVWTDPPSSALAEVNLINDLDLVVSGPDGIFRGNVFVEGVSVLGGDADRLNNVEVVWLPNASPGLWSVQVSAYSVAQGPQDYAIVVVSAFADYGPRKVAGRRDVNTPAEVSQLSGRVTQSESRTARDTLKLRNR
ncbi:MAG: hypothetical protein GY906_00965, partial [bacterium]|nr:hypothetical protein [bacterium]